MMGTMTQFYSLVSTAPTRGDASDDFLLARDRTYPSMTLASQAFVDLCAAERLNIDFAPVTMSA